MVIALSTLGASQIPLIFFLRRRTVFKPMQNFTQTAYLTIYQFFPYEKSKQIVMLFPNKREKDSKFDAGGIILP